MNWFIVLAVIAFVCAAFGVEIGTLQLIPVGLALFAAGHFAGDGWSIRRSS